MGGDVGSGVGGGVGGENLAEILSCGKWKMGWTGKGDVGGDCG